MGAAFFYHLTESPITTALPQLLGRALEQGWRVEVRGTDPSRLEALDTAIWTATEDSFLPHGIAGGDHDADQPILLTCGQPATNGATCLVSVDGAQISAKEVAASERTMIVFDGLDANAVQTAREAWKRLTSEGIAAQYWAQEGGWTKKAESGT